MSGAFICINSFNIPYKIVGTLPFPLGNDKTETRAKFSEMCPLSFSPLSHFILSFATLSCAVTNPSSHPCGSDLGGVFLPVSPLPPRMPFLTLWAIARLYDP